MAAPSSRLEFIDTLRGWAVFVMIETHIVNALLLQQLKDQAPFKVLTFVNGLVAPSFLFCAGLAYAVTLGRKWNDYVMLRRPLGRYLVKLLFLLVVGYSLHLPFFSLRKLWGITDAQVWIPFFQADILQTIAVSLFALTLLAILVRNQRWYWWVVGAITVVIIFAAPPVRDADTAAWPAWLRPYFTTQVKTQFPLFPWTAFLFAGALAGRYFLVMKEKGSEALCMRRLSIWSVAAIVLSLAAEALPVTLYPHHDFWRASPEFFFVRAAIVALALAALWAAGRRQSSLASPAMLRLFGTESLIVYVVHLLVVYGYTYEWSFIRLFGQTLNYLQCAALFVLLSAAMYAMAWLWSGMKHRNLRYAKAAQFATLGAIVVMFLVKEG